MSKIKLDTNGWILVADGKKALFLRNEGDAVFPNLRVVREIERENPPARDQGSDRPGRMSNLGTPVSSVDDTDWHRLGKSRFAGELAEILHRHAHREDFSQLIIVAPPVILGELRKSLDGHVMERVIAEIGKDLTAHTVDKIEHLVLQTDPK